MQYILKHIPHYISLVGILVAGFVGFYIYSYDRFFQIGIIVALCFSYISWGIIHHAIHGDISLSIVVEYLAVALLGSVMALSLIFRT